MAREIILTGIPRAGTTLAAAIIDGLVDSVCLNEPSWHNPRAALDAQDFVKFVGDDFTKLRQVLSRGDAVLDRRAADCAALTNYYECGMNGDMQENFTIAPFARLGLSADFTLAIKHNAAYLGVLPELIAQKRFTIIAIIRHPLPVIRSWRRLQLPISRGDLPSGKPFWPELRGLVDAPMDLLEKQVKLYELMLARILKYEQHITVIDYDALKKNPQLLADTIGKKPLITPPLVSAKAEIASEEDEQIIRLLHKPYLQ